MKYTDAAKEISKLVASGKIEEAGKYIEAIVEEVKSIYEDGMREKEIKLRRRAVEV
jgi:hypothetical protein